MMLLNTTITDLYSRFVNKQKIQFNIRWCSWFLMSILIAYFVVNQQCDFQILMPRLNDIDALSSHWYCISWVVYGVNELYVFSFYQILQKCCHFLEKKKLQVVFKRSLSEAAERFKKRLFIMIIVIILNVLIMSLYESQLACMSISESQSVSENVEDKKVLLHDRNRRYCREDSQKLHTNEKLHARERLRSESHFRLVINGKQRNLAEGFFWNAWKYSQALTKVPWHLVNENTIVFIKLTYQVANSTINYLFFSLLFVLDLF